MLLRLTLALAIAAANAAIAQAAEAPRADLLGVYQDALDNNATLAAARAEYAATHEQVPQARAGLLPQLSAGAGVEHNRSTVDSTLGELHSNRSAHLYQLTLSQPLFHAERWYQLRAAKAIDQQAALQLSALEQRLILQAAEGYFAVLRAQDSLAATRAEEAAFKRQLDQASERFEVGLSDKTDVLEAQASHDNARASRLLGERAVADALQGLGSLTAQDYSALQGIAHDLPVSLPQPNDAQAWVDTAAHQNLELQAGGYAVRAAEEQLRQRKAGHAPTLDARAQYGRGDNDALGFINSGTAPGYNGSAEQGSIAVQLNVPLYSGGLTRSQVREAGQRVEQREQQREQQRRQVVQDTRNLHRAVNTDVETVSARRQSIRSSQSALEATEIGYQVGTRNIVDVLNAQRQLYAALRNYNDARYDYILNGLRLKQVAGTLAPADLQGLSAYLKADYEADRDYLPGDLLQD